MKYINVSEAAKQLNISERSVRNYCLEGRIPGAVREDSAWMIPENTEKPCRKARTIKLPETLLERLKLEKESNIPGGIYHKIQIDLTYNSNHIEGSTLTHDQTRYIFETSTFESQSGTVNVDDIVETANHFRCIDLLIDMANYQLSESFIKQLHLTLKTGTSDSRKGWFSVGGYKKLDNEVGGIMTTKPEEVAMEMRKLLADYNIQKKKTFEEIIDFHYKFERIHPFQDGNGRIGRLIMFKECLRNGITPFIIGEDIKAFYYRGLLEYEREPGYLVGTCLSAQDRFREVMGKFGIK